MEKAKTFSETRFSAETLRQGVAAFETLALSLTTVFRINGLEVEHADSKWSYDVLAEFFADYHLHSGKAGLDLRGQLLILHMQIYPRSTYVSVKAPDRASIESIFQVFEHALSKSILPPEENSSKKKDLAVFVGHGRSSAWRELKDHLQDKHGIKVVAYETGARAGHTIRDILEEMVESSTFALLVMTAEDEQSDGTIRARQNVIHEAGLFQGRLGFSKAIMVVEEGTENFSNVHGVQQIRFGAGNIKEVFGEVLATVHREFPAGT